MQTPPYGSAPMYGGLRPLGVGEILDRAIQVYRQNFRALVTMTAAVIIPLRVVTVLINLSARPGTRTASSNTFGGIQFGSTTTNGHDAAVRLAAVLVVGILSLGAGALAVGACTRGVSDAYLGGAKADAGASLRVALRSLGSLVWLELLTVLGAGLGLVFCVLPGVWLWTSWIVATPVLLVEGTRGTHALQRSFSLVKNRWWPTFAVVLVAALLAGAVSSALSFALVGVLFATRDTNSTGYIVSSGAIAAVASLITTPFVAAAYVITYFDLRVRYEGLDLQMVLATLDSPVTPNIASPPWPSAPQTPGGWGGPPPGWGAPAPPAWGNPSPPPPLPPPAFPPPPSPPRPAAPPPPQSPPEARP